MDGDGSPARAFHGRRKGKRLRDAQSDRLGRILPRLRIEADGAGPIDPRSLFDRPVERIVLEIGFGGGEHLAACAAAERTAGFIGVEPFVNGMAKLFAAVETERLDNVRVFDDDATLLLPRLPPGSVDAVFLLFPDPWPKRRQRKRRFVSDENLGLIARALRPGGEFRFATDIDDYAGWTLARVLRSPDFAWRPERADEWRRPWDGWPGTRYEAKAAAAGRGASYLRVLRASVAA